MATQFERALGAGIKALRKAPKPSEGQMDTCSITVHTAVDAGDRALLRTKPKEKLDELLALKARFTMHKWKKDGFRV